MIKQRFKINWVLNDELAIGLPPSKIKHLNYLKENGFKSILSLCNEEEVKLPDNIDKLFVHKRYVLPDHKTGKLPSVDEINNVLDLIKTIINKGPLYVHCFAAVERSPLICMAWLIKEHKITPKQALEYMMQVNPGTSPLPLQYKLLQEI